MMRHLSVIVRSIATLALAAVLAACAPQAQPSEQGDPPLVAVINAPADDRVTALAGELESAVADVSGCCAFEFHFAPPIRFQETHRNLFGSRAVPQSAALARNLGADIAVLASAPVFEREEQVLDGEREIRGTVQLEAMVIDAGTEEILGTVVSTTFSGRRYVDEQEQLPDVEEDPLMQRLLDDAVEDLAPHLAALLTDVSER